MKKKQNRTTEPTTNHNTADRWGKWQMANGGGRGERGEGEGERKKQSQSQRPDAAAAAAHSPASAANLLSAELHVSSLAIMLSTSSAVFLVLAPSP